MKSHFFVRAEKLTDDSAVYVVHFFDGDTGEQTVIFHAEDLADADERNNQLNLAIGYK